VTRTPEVLRAKGYDVDDREFAGAHEYLNWRGTISDGTHALLPEPWPLEFYDVDLIDTKENVCCVAET